MTGASPTTRHLGIDIGATNLKSCVVARKGDAWDVVSRDQRQTLAAEGSDAVIGRLIEIGRAALLRWPDIASVGIGVPGVYDPTRGTTSFLVNMPGAWRGVAVAGPVASALGLPTALINDARAFGLAELRLGAGRGASSIVGLTLGTGVGGVIAVDGRVVMGHDGSAGEIGHQTLDPDGPPCNCGNNGCLEAFARADRIAEACGTATVEAAIEAARAGDPAARAGLARVGRYLGLGIGNAITIVSPDRVVIGGGVAAAGDVLLDAVRAELQRRVTMTGLAEVELVTAELGIWAGAIGAAVHGAEAAAASGTGPAPIGGAA